MSWLVWLPCVKQVQQNLHRPNFNPCWKPICMFSNKISTIENCHSSLYTDTSFASVTEIETLLEERIHRFTTDGSQECVGLF